MDYQPVPVIKRRAIGLAGAFFLFVTVLVVAATAAVTMAAPDETTATTLTLAKVTAPAGGQDFPISAVGYIGSFNTSFKSPRDVDRDSAGHIYAVDFKVSKVEVFNATGTSLDAWGKKGHDQQEMFRPEDIAVVDDGANITVIVADTGNHRLQFYDETGDYIKTIGSLGTGNGQFSGPQGVVTDTEGNIYVADTSNHRIQVLDSDGVFLRTWGSEGTANGQFRYPAGIDIGPDGNVYVADSNNHRIQVFTEDGTFVRKWGRNGNDPGEFNYPTHVAVADDGLLVSDTYNQRIQKFTNSGRFLTLWGSPGNGPMEFERPNGLYVSSDGLVLVVDIDTARIEIYQQVTSFLDDGEEAAFVVLPGLYEITEPVEDGWVQTDVTCEGSDVTELPTGVELTLENDVPVKCTFGNESTAQPDGSITVTKYNDLDLSGSNTAGDVPLGGWTFRLRDDQGLQVGNDVITDEAGTVVFEALTEAEYEVCELLPADWFNTEPGVLGQPIQGTGGEVCGPATVIAGEATTVSFGNVAAATVTVTKVTDPVGATASFDFTSDVPELNGSLSDGQSLSATLLPGVYTVTEAVSVEAFLLSSVVCDDTDSIGNATNRTAVFTVAPGEAVTCTFTNTADISDPTGEISVLIYEDVDESGSQSVGDLRLANWTVRLRNGEGSVIMDESLSDIAGLVAFDDLPVGDYQVCQVLPVGWINLDPGDAGQPIIGADQEVCIDTAVIADSTQDIAFGNVMEEVIEPTGEIAVVVYEDVDQSGNQSAGDLPLADWTIRLRASEGNVILDEKLSDANGQVAFVDLPVGDYQVCQVLPLGWINVDPGDAGQPIVGADQEVCIDTAVVADTMQDIAFGNVMEELVESYSLYLPMLARP